MFPAPVKSAPIVPPERGHLTQLDALLGPGVVYANPNGSLRLNQSAFDAQRHQSHPEQGQRCWCPRCKADRERDPQEVRRVPRQPWEPIVRKAA